MATDSRIYNPVEVTYAIKEHSSISEGVYTRLKELPAIIGMLLEAADTPKKIEQLCTSLNLTETQSMYLAKIIRDTAIGTIPLANLLEELKSQMDVPDQIAMQIGQFIMNDLMALAIPDIKSIQPTAPGDPRAQGNIINLRNKP